MARDESGRRQRDLCRAAGNVVSKAEHVDWKDDYADDDYTERGDYQAEIIDGIERFRWARSADDAHKALGNPRADELGGVPFLNSWGPGIRTAHGCRTMPSTD
jgi:hypothetical protein